MMAVTPLSLSQREQAAQLGAQDRRVGQPGEQRLDGVEHDPPGADGVDGVAQSDEETLEVVLAGLLDLAPLDPHVAHDELLVADQPGQGRSPAS